MNHAAPATPAFDVSISCSILCVSADSIVVKNLGTGRVHRFGYDHILIGSDKEQRCYEIRMPRWLADHAGIRVVSIVNDAAVHP